MGILTWIILGGVAGWLASLIMNTDAEQGIGENIIVGIIGAIAGGLLSSMLGEEGVTGFNLRSIIIATLGAVVVLCVVHFIRGKTA